MRFIPSARFFYRRSVMSNFDFDPTSLLIVAGCVVVFVIQLLLCLRARHVWVRLIPTVLSVLVVAFLFAMIHISDGWDAVGYLLLAIIACFPVATCILTWIIFGIVCIFRRRRSY